jgi:DNA-binding transcriptional MerR regulator
MSYIENSPTIKLNFSEADNIFKSIGDVSAEIGVPPHVLRFWESKFLYIKPHKRKGGHRYYSTKDVETIYEIKKLLYEQGYTIKGAQKKLREHNMNKNNDQQSLFASNQQQIEKQVAGFVNSELNLFEEAKQKNYSQIETKPDANVIKNFLDELELIKNMLNA